MTACETCIEEGGSVRPVMVHLLGQPEGVGDFCARHIVLMVIVLRFLATEGPQSEEDIIAMLTKFEAEYSWPSREDVTAANP